MVVGKVAILKYFLHHPLTQTWWLHWIPPT